MKEFKNTGAADEFESAASSGCHAHAADIFLRILDRRLTRASCRDPVHHQSVPVTIYQAIPSVLQFGMSYWTDACNGGKKVLLGSIQAFGPGGEFLDVGCRVHVLVDLAMKLALNHVNDLS